MSIGKCLCSVQTEYTTIGGDEELPLGEEFQSHVRCFINYSEKKPPKRFELAAKLIEQLAWVLDFLCERLEKQLCSKDSVFAIWFLIKTLNSKHSLTPSLAHYLVLYYWFCLPRYKFTTHVTKMRNICEDIYADHLLLLRAFSCM